MAGNPQAIQNLMSNRDAIRRIMQRDANGEMDQIAESARKNGTLTGGEEGATYKAPDKPQQPKGPQQIIVNENVMKKHPHMPRQILESLRDNPIKDMPLPSGMGGSVLEGLDIPQASQQQVVQEAVQQAPIQQTVSSNIDYSLIKTIINEAVQENVKKYVTAMYKKLSAEQKALNEGNTIRAIKLGENFSLITENQDIYTCKPSFKRNLND